MKRSGVTAPRGFLASGVPAGIKPEGPDLAVLVSEVTCSAAAVFTRNRVQAAPIAVCREHLEQSAGRARAVVVNSGNANACTGEAGLRATVETTETAARCLDVPPCEILVASTGVIGQPLPVERLVAALPGAVEALSTVGGVRAADAILTTDTCRKESHRHVTTDQGDFTVGGMAKGSGMIHPDMATTLGFVTTDAAVEPAFLADCLREATDRTFNRISVDGDTSTNDTIIMLANGASGTGLALGSADAGRFREALTSVLLDLAKAVARDGEGATRLITVEVTGAGDENAALQVARTIASSPLVKTAVYGADANWGRIVGAAGRAGVPFDPSLLTVAIGGLVVLAPGYRSEFSEDEATLIMKEDEVVITVDLGGGSGTARTWTCDLTHGYVDINASYRT